MNTKQMRFEFTQPTNDGLVMKVSANGDKTCHRIFFRSNDVALVGTAEACVAVGLLTCMRMGYDLVSSGTISRRMFDALSRITSLYRSWEPSLANVCITGVTPEPRSAREANRVGAFFSGGVDSFYTLLKHEQEITDIIFVHGFDVPLKNERLRSVISKMVRNVGSQLGKGVIEIETDVKRFMDPHIRWGLSHGSALAAVGHLMAPYFRRIYIAATHTYEDSFGWGSHPDLDRHWSTESLEFVHDGCEARRLDKVAMISQSDVALQSLRVCFKNPDNAYNCGRCEKCLRTMINLHAAGALDRCTTFAATLEPESVARLLAPDDNTRAFFLENLKALEGSSADRELCDALRKVLQRPFWKTRALKFLRSPVHDSLSMLRDQFPPAYQRLQRTYRALRGRHLL